MIVRALACIALLVSPVASINAARVAHGLPRGTTTTAYTKQVDIGLAQRGDPPLPKPAKNVVVEYGLWGRDASASAVIRDWVARDGFLGSATLNVNCPHAEATGCNLHREAILSRVTHAHLLIDVGTKRDGSQTEVVAILVWVRS